MQSLLLRDVITEYFPQVRRPGMRITAGGQGIPRSVFLQALDALNQKLQERGVRMTFFCVGGGAMLLAFDAREKTEDLDGILAAGSADLLHQIAKEVSADFHDRGGFPLPSDWINTQVAPMMREQGFQRSNFEELPGLHWSHLTLLFAKPDYLLAMKAQALRLGTNDFADIVTLIRKLNIRTLAALKEVVDQYADWEIIGNDEIGMLKLSIAWAFPGQTAYEPIRQEALERYRKVKHGSQTFIPGSPGRG